MATGKTYTFAMPGEPAAEHMRGLLEGLRKWAAMANRDSEQAITRQAKDRNYGRMLAFKEVIAVIEDSNSI